jgi:hypothetical protein
MQIWVPTNPRGAERLPPGIIESESDLFLRRLWGQPSEVCIFYHNFNVKGTFGLSFPIKSQRLWSCATIMT